MGQPSSPQYLLLHSIKEILHQDTESEILPYASHLWNNLVAASQAEDNKAIGSECIGRLTIADPKTFLPQLRVSCSSDIPLSTICFLAFLCTTFTALHYSDFFELVWKTW